MNSPNTVPRSHHLLTPNFSVVPESPEWSCVRPGTLSARGTGETAQLDRCFGSEDQPCVAGIGRSVVILAEELSLVIEHLEVGVK